MNDDWIDQVTAIIRSSELVAYPLDRLREELARRFRVGPPAIEELRRRLQQRPDRFIVLEPASLPGLGAADPASSPLLGALRAAGLAPPHQVMLRGDAEPATEAEEAAPLTRGVSRSLTLLWTARERGAMGKAELVQATRAANELRGTLRRLAASPRLPSPAPARGGTRTAGSSAASGAGRWGEAAAGSERR